MKNSKIKYRYKYMSIILLKNNSNNLNLIEFSFGDFRYIIDQIRFSSIEDKTLTQSIELNSDKLKSIVLLNSTSYTKEAPIEYISSLVTDISNFQYLINNFSQPTSIYYITIDTEKYLCNSFFNLNGMNYYILNKSV